MALVVYDRVQETTTTTGTGSVTLLGAVTGYQSFAVVGNSNTTYYCIADQGGSNWEVGIGTYSTTGPTLARTTVLSSSNSGSLVNFPAGTKTVFVTYPAGRSVYGDGTISVTGTGSNVLATSPTITGLTFTSAASAAPAFAANGSALTSAATDTFTKISYNTKIFDTNTNYSTANSRFTPTVAGYYQFNAFISGPAASSGNNYLFFSFFKNGSRYADSQTTILQLTINVAVIGTAIIYCNGSTDYVECYGYQGSGVTANIGSQYGFQQFSAAMIRSA